jgi:hypothetical protein
MKLTDTQHNWLKWLHNNGGSAFIERHWIIANGERSTYGSEISFLNLVVKGAIEARNGRLVITDYGYRILGVKNKEVAA